MDNIKKTKDNDLTVFSVEGPITVKGMIHAVIEFYEDSPTPNVIWDLSMGDLTGLRKKDMENIAFLGMKYSDERPCGKTAIVINSSELARRLARIYEDKINFVPLQFETKTFEDLEEAYGWVSSSE